MGKLIGCSDTKGERIFSCGIHSHNRDWFASYVGSVDEFGGTYRGINTKTYLEQGIDTSSVKAACPICVKRPGCILVLVCDRPYLFRNFDRQWKMMTKVTEPKVRDIGYVVGKTKWKYAGHLVWREDEKLAKLTTMRGYCTKIREQ